MDQVQTYVSCMHMILVVRISGEKSLGPHSGKISNELCLCGIPLSEFSARQKHQKES